MPITLDGTNGITTPTYGGADTSEYLVPVTQFKNRIINGAMMIDQRNAGASVTPLFSYTLDRWYAQEDTDGAITVQQVAEAPSGFVNSLKVTVTTADSSLGATQTAFIQQAIEGLNVADLGWGTANASAITLSFWVRSSLTGTFGGALKNSAGNRSYPFTYVINTANTWEQKTITIVGDTTGTWLTTNGVGIQVQLGLGVGSTFSGTAGSWQASNFISATGVVNVMGTLNATWQVTGVQLEKGSTATSFDYRPYGTELALCQRYCEVIRPSGVTNFVGLGIGQAYSSTQAAVVYYYQVAKRAAPTVTYDTASKYGVTNSTSSTIALTAISTDRSDVTVLVVNCTVSSGLSAGNASRWLDNANSYPVTIISAEL